MVFLSEQAYWDIENIFDGLLAWRKVELSREEVRNYVNELVDHCYSIDTISSHTRATYPDHQKYGSFVYPYKRNKNTTWYIIYEKTDNCIFIYKIMNNHLTVSI